MAVTMFLLIQNQGFFPKIILFVCTGTMCSAQDLSLRPSHLLTSSTFSDVYSSLSYIEWKMDTKATGWPELT